MSNLELYKQCFCEIFSIEHDFDGSNIKMNVTPDWDSVGHMDLITRIEEQFDVLIDPEDILQFTSYQAGIEILKKYDIAI